MNLLKPGYTPPGWTRGERLFIMQARPGMRGAIGQSIDDYPLSAKEVPDNKYLIEFHYDDHKEVDEWLKWWRNPCYQANNGCG